MAIRIPSGVVDQYVYFVAVDSTDLKTRETGLTTFTVYRSRDGAASAVMTTPTINETDTTNMPGVYELLLDEDMTIGAGNDSEAMVFHITQAAMAPVTLEIELYRPKITAGNTLTVDAGGTGAADVLEWLGTAAATPTVAGVPEVDLTHVAGSTTSVSTVATSIATLLADIGGVATAAADGDPTSTDLLFAYIKQLINILVGSAGVVTFPAAAAPANAVSLAEIIRAIYDDTNALPDSGALTTLQADTDNIQTRLPAALVAGKMDSVADVTAISGDTTAADNLESEYDGVGYGQVLQRTTIATLASQTSFTLTAGSADNDAYNGCIIVIQDVTTAAQKAVAVVLDYTGATKTITLLTDPAVFTMAATDIVTLIADRALKATVDNRNLDVSAGGEAGLDWANIGSPTTAQNLSATNIDVDQVVASVSGAVGSVTGAVGSVTGLTAATVHSDLDDIQARLPAALVVGRMDSSVGAMAADVVTAAAIANGAIDAATFAAGAIDAAAMNVTGSELTAIPWNAAWDAEVQSEVEDALDVTIADSVPADGTRPSVRSGILQISRILMEMGIVGTTMTVYKEDGTTAAMTFTLNSATDPSAVTRAT